MLLPKNLSKKITEVAYLNTENTIRYRHIMRIFFNYNQQFTHWLKKEDIFNTLREQAVFSSYTIEMCESDLAALVNWGNLSTVQDTSKVSTYQQFINKQFRYQMTEYAIEIERLMLKLETLRIESGSLEPTLLERLYDLIEQIPEISAMDNKNRVGWWNQLTADFQRLNQNYQDYIRQWHTVKAEEMLKTEAFLLYKDKLIEYLRSFIIELQEHAYRIEGTLKRYDQEMLLSLAKQISDSEQALRIFDNDDVTEAERCALIIGKLNSIISFFVGKNGRSAEVEIILDMTNEIIRRLTRYASNILELSRQCTNRKEEYLLIANYFSELDNIDDCHLLSAQVFGIDSYLHYTADTVRETEDITSSIYDETPNDFVFSPKTRKYREKMQKCAIKDFSHQKKQQIEQILKQRTNEQALLKKHLSSGTLNFADLPKIDSATRRTLLRWLIKGLRAGGASVSTENGEKYRVLNITEKERCLLKSEDGNLEMPAYTLEFEV